MAAPTLEMTLPAPQAASALPDVLVLDTCVLISNVLRKWLLDLAEDGCFQVAWSSIIGDEWRRTASRLWDVDAEAVQEQWDAMQQAFPAADQGEIAQYKEGLCRSDPKDWHVIAAGRAVLARRPSANVAIVTRNTRDFNRGELRRLGLGLMDPDIALARYLAGRPAQLRASLAKVPAYALAPGRGLESVDTILKRERLFRFNRLCTSAQ